MKQLNNSSTPKGRKVFKRRILFFLFLILAVIASILFLYLKRTVDQERKQDKIEEEITTEKEKDGVGNLHKKYKDMIGWLEIKGTGFSYPVMQTGIEGHHKDDWQYYLHRDVHGEYSFYGTPFLDVRCTTDSDNLIMDFSLLTTSGVSQKRNEAVGNTKPPAMRVEDKLLYKKITFPL